MRKITKPEVANLYTFTRKHYVEYYDLQTELVDHLANGMEIRWEENLHLEFEENLQLEFKKFGVYGFSEVVEKKQRAMNKKYLHLIWKEIRSVISNPKILFFTILLMGVCTFLMSFKTGFIVLYFSIVLLALVGMIYLFKANFSYNKKKKKQEKIYLLEEMIINTGGMHNLLLLPFYLLNIGNPDFSVNGIYVSLLYAFFISTMAFLGYVCFHILPKKKDEILKKAYPEMNLGG